MEYEYKGLNDQEVEQSRAQHGPNVLTPPPRQSVWKLFFEKFNDPIIRVLLFAAILSFAVGFIDMEFAEAIGITCAVILATGVAFWFEYDAMKRFEVLNTVNDDIPVKVIRNSQLVVITRREVVVGDVVLLESGEEIPADGNLLQCVSLRVNESSLTGEPSVSKSTDPAAWNPDATYPTDRLMRGSTVMEGHGVVRIDAVGDQTEYGKVADQATAESDEQTPLNKQLSKLSKYISRVGVGLAILVFIVLLVKGWLFKAELDGGAVEVAQSVLKYFMVSVAIVVMAIPEGLPMSITLSLALNMRRMLKTNNLVRKMHACETMGAVTVICTDKTGTLTRNQMSVREMVRYDAMPDEDFARSIAVNTTAFLDAQHSPVGNPTEGALLLWLAAHGFDYAGLRGEAEVADQMTFTTERKYMATLVRDGASNLLFVKGAPEIVRTLCAPDGRDHEVQSTLLAFQEQAMRTLGFAVARSEKGLCEEAIAEGNLAFVAVAAIADPVRDDVPQAVERCLNAGIKVKVVTGDTPATAREIARQVGLWTDADGDRNQITGPEFAAMSDGELLERVGDLKIMARARPLDKQRLVRLLQQKDEVVAVTGDGTNDAPALNFAQVGLSMGSGTSVAREASDITLLDDSFSSIATAVMWGRSLYKNIQRFVLFQLTINLAACAIVLVGSIFGTGLPLTVTQILWVNLIMDTLAAMAFASLTPSEKVMKEKPRKPTDFIVSPEMFRTILITGGSFAAVLLAMLFWRAEPLNDYGLSVFFTVFVMMQVWNMFNAKAFGTPGSSFIGLRQNRVFGYIIVAILAGQVLIVNFGGEVFRTVPISVPDWLMIAGCTSAVLWVGEIVRAIRFRREYF